MFESVLKESIEDGGSPCVDKECDTFFFFFLDDDDFWKFHFEFDDRSGYFLGFECNYFE